MRILETERAEKLASRAFPSYFLCFFYEKHRKMGKDRLGIGSFS